MLAEQQQRMTQQQLLQLQQLQHVPLRTLEDEMAEVVRRMMHWREAQAKYACCASPCLLCTVPAVDIARSPPLTLCAAFLFCRVIEGRKRAEAAAKERARRAEERERRLREEHQQNEAKRAKDLEQWKDDKRRQQEEQQRQLDMLVKQEKQRVKDLAAANKSRIEAIAALKEQRKRDEEVCSASDLEYLCNPVRSSMFLIPLARRRSSLLCFFPHYRPPPAKGRFSGREKKTSVSCVCSQYSTSSPRPRPALPSTPPPPRVRTSS